MTISNDTSAAVFTVVGATGAQGSSVVRALAASSKVYRVRAITRDASRPAAQKLKELGCEVLEADIGTKEGAFKAFAGAELGFAMTASDYSNLDTVNEYNQGKWQIEGAKAGGVKVLAWSGLPDTKELSKGQVLSPAFQVKADVAAYGRSLGGIKIVDVQPGYFASNPLTLAAPRKQEDGSFVFAEALSPDAPLPVIDIEEDLGKFVVGSIEDGSLDTVLAAGSYTTPRQMAEELAKASGKQVSYFEVPDDVYLEELKPFFGEGGRQVLEMYQFINKIGYYGGAELEESQKVLSSPPRTFAQTLAANPESVAKIFA